jgi:hypothetical protein
VVKLPATVPFVFIVATAAIHWSVFSWLEWYLRVDTTFSTHRREHLAVVSGSTRSTRTKAVPLCLSCLAAGLAASGLISESLGLMEFLLLGSEGECDTTISTL